MSCTDGSRGEEEFTIDACDELPLKTVTMNYSVCADCDRATESRDHTYVTTLFPLPSRIELYFARLGTAGDGSGEEKPVEQVASILRLLLEMIEAGESYGAVLGTTRDTLAAAIGAVEVLLEAGWRVSGETLYCADAGHGRATIVRQLIQDELSLLDCTTRRLTRPLLDRVPGALSKFDALEKKAGRRYYFFQDLTDCIEARNLFYMLSLTSTGPDAETWVDYFVAARDMANDILQQQQQVNRALRIADDPNIPLVPVRWFDTKPSVPHGSFGGPAHTPSTAHLQQTPQHVKEASPGEILLRTPDTGNDRMMYKMNEPAMETLTRDVGAEFAGLVNLRQCCYVNVVIQSLFVLPHFPQLVLQFPSKEQRILRGLSPHVKVVTRLQSVFGYLAASSVTCINPVWLLDAVAAVHPQFADERQHDPHEFAQCLMESVAVAFRDVDEALRSSPSAAHEKPQPRDAHSIRTLLDEFEDKENNEPRGESHVNQLGDAKATKAPLAAPLLPRLHAIVSRVNVFTVSGEADAPSSEPAESAPAPWYLPVYLPVGEPDRSAETTAPTKHVDPFNMAPAVPPTLTLARAMRDYFVDHHEGSGGSVGSVRCFDARPETVGFYLPQRTNAAAGAKNDTPLAFTDTLDMSRFIDGSKKGPNVVQGLRESLALTQKVFDARRDAATCEKAAALAVELSNLLPQCPSNGTAVAKPLRDVVAAVEQKRKASHFTASELASALQKSFGSGAEDDNVFRLQSVIVHEGATTSAGHYYAFIQDFATDPSQPKWYRFDDTTIVSVGAAEVFSEHTQRNVYCVTYVSAAAAASMSRASVADVPQHLVDIIDAEDMKKITKIAQRASMAS